MRAGVGKMDATPHVGRSAHVLTEQIEHAHPSPQCPPFRVLAMFFIAGVWPCGGRGSLDAVGECKMSRSCTSAASRPPRGSRASGRWHIRAPFTPMFVSVCRRRVGLVYRAPVLTRSNSDSMEFESAVYGLGESFGPWSLCASKASFAARAAGDSIQAYSRKAREAGVRTGLADRLRCHGEQISSDACDFMVALPPASLRGAHPPL